MESKNVYLASKRGNTANLRELASATGRKVVSGQQPPDSAQAFDTYEQLLSEMHGELSDAKEQQPNDLDRRPGENREQHRARLKIDRRKVATE